MYRGEVNVDRKQIDPWKGWRKTKGLGLLPAITCRTFVCTKQLDNGSWGEENSKE